MTRRRFLSAASLPRLLRAAAPYDWIIRNGRVIDPSQRLDRVLDVAISDGKIAALGRNLHGARETIDATGLIVTPGLIDIHLHARDAALTPTDILATGVTTIVDAGSRGADNVDQLIDIAKDANRMRILLNIGRLGNNPNGRGEFLDGIEPADVDKARAAVEKNRAWVVGIKARLSRSVAADHDLEILRRAQQVAAPLNIPVMIHIGDTASPLPQILALLRPGDIVTHLYAPTQGILDAHGRVLPEVRAARRRGVIFDFGNGRTAHWTWDVAQTALAQGFAPDTISSDLDLAGHTEQVFDLPTVLSKFLAMGMPLPQVIARATINAAKVFPEFKGLGSLRPNSPADVAIFELAEGNFDLVDNFQSKRTARQKLIARTVIAGGKRYSPDGHPR